MSKYINLCEALLHNVTCDGAKGITFINSSKLEKKLTYKELYNKALSYLYIYEKKGIDKGSELVFQVEDNETFICAFWACLLGGIIPVPITIGTNDEHKNKLFKVWKQLNNPFLLINENVLEKIEKFAYESNHQEEYKELVRNAIYIENLEENGQKGKMADINPDDIAFIQFSSGSTGDPKGVVLTHKNLISNTYAIVNCSGITKEDSMLTWMPLTHDMGIIGFHLTPLVNNIEQYIMPTSLFIRRPTIWMEKATKYRVTHLSSPNFGYKYLLTFYKPEIGEDWDLSCIKLIFNGAEPISAELCNKFLDEMSKHGLKRSAMFTVYGLAEASVGVSLPPPGDEFITVYVDRDRLSFMEKIREVEPDDSSCLSFVDVGSAIDDVSLRIADNENNQLEDNTVGNIQIKGMNVTQGYYNNPTATKNTINEDGWLNTGDLGFMRNNRLVITGRAKDIIFINGQNYYPHDIERVAENLDDISLGHIAACGVQSNETKSEELILFVMFKKKPEEFAKLALSLKKCINMNMGLDVKAIIPVRKIPKTTSGKVQRYKLGKMFQAGDFDKIWHPVEAFMLEELKKTQKQKETESSLQDKLLGMCREVLGNKDISSTGNFFEWGINSLQLTTITEKVNEEYPGKISVTDLFAYPTIAKLADYIENGENVNKNQNNSTKTIEDEDVAIIGMSLKLPMAEDVNSFWENIKNGKDCVTEFPKHRRKDIDAYLNFMGKDIDKVDYVKGAYLNEVDKFDYKLFKMTPKEASLMNPNQRIFLETAWQVIADAGYSEKGLIKSKTGVYLGYIGDAEGYKYRQMVTDVDESLSSMSMAGNLPSIIPSRISYIMDLKGPTMLIDTACSSSLVSVHLACQGLLKGDCDMAIAGGVKVSLLPFDGQEKIGMESSDGKARTFDNSADGTGTGEGVAVVLLKPLSKALRDRDNIYAVVKGSAINQDGNSIGITAPNVLSQADVLDTAWKNAGINPETLSYIEAHGTGTKLGDPIEIDGIKKAFRRYTDKNQFCAIGSVKPNVGHLFEAAGITSLIKSVLALRNKQIPPSINFKSPNNEISFEDSPVYVSDILSNWESKEEPRRCGVSAFGFSGTNCHLVLEEAPVINKLQKSVEDNHNILTLSARSQQGLKKLIRKYRDFVSDKINLGDVCYTANTGRVHYDYRTTVLASNLQELRLSIEELLDKEEFLSIENIPKADKLGLTKKGNIALKQYAEKGKNDKKLLDEISKLYISGADIDWSLLYTNEYYNKASIPLYQLERERCWIDIPGAVNYGDGNVYYGISFKEQVINMEKKISGNGSVVIIKGSSQKSDDLCEKLKQAGHLLIEVTIGESYKSISSSSYMIGDNEEDYIKLFSQLDISNISDIIHVASLKNSEILTLDELVSSQKHSTYSLFYLTRALLKSKSNHNIGLVLISDYVNSVTGQEEYLKPENASIFALGKAIDKEYANITVRCIDIDNETSIDEVYEGFKYQQEYRSSYRKGRRYIEEFASVDVEGAKEQKISIKNDGVYVITGGMGGIGLELAKSLADKNNVRLGLIGRTEMPDVSKWDEILSKAEDKKTCKKIMAIREIEAKGTKVLCLSANASNMLEMNTAINSIRDTYGRIDGIIHGAGIAGDGYIAKKDEKIFSSVIEPKIYGTWILNHLTKNDKLDFFVLFSSVASVFTVQGQGDYSAANSYMDAFSEYSNKKGRKALAINWVPWKETGMAVNHGANTDTIFKAIYTDRALEAFEQVLSTDIQRILIGEVNFDSKMVFMLERFPLRLSKSIKKELEKCRKRFEAQEKSTETEKKISDACRVVLGIKEIDVYQSFFDLGADSIMLTKLSEKLEKMFPGKVTVSKMFGHPTIAKLAEHIDEQDNTALEDTISQKSENAVAGDIAIIGMSAKMPGAENPEELWNIVKNGQDHIKVFPSTRKRDIDSFLEYTGTDKTKIKYTDGGYLDHIDKFDYNFFRLTPMEASLMDPNQRLFLETVYGAIEDAGYSGKKIIGSNTAIYTGFGNNPRDTYMRMISEVDSELVSVSIPSNIPAIIPSRASYVLDLKGQSILLDTACSSSLVAIHLACNALKKGECDMAIAGGVKINLFPIEGEIKLGIESSDSRARTFDDSSDGTGTGEGAGAVMLKPLDKAIADGDNIYAVIKGSAVNQDGSSAGITAPNASAQTQVLINGWKDAGINPETLSYIEAHGTGTKLGDPIEIDGLTQAFRKYTDKKQFCAISSVKTNIGHLFEAAGMAGIIKAVMSLKNKKIAPNVHFKKPNHRIDFEEAPVYVSTQLEEWKSKDFPRRCGISAFGLSGTNCHMVLEEYIKETVEAPVQLGSKVLTISAKSEKALKELIKRYKGLNDKNIDFVNLCYTASTGRGHYDYRLAIIADNLEELISKLESMNNDFCGEDVFYGESKLVNTSKDNKKDLNIEDIKELSKEADLKLKEYVATGKSNIQLLNDICSLYAKGADVEWEELYEGENTNIISLPTYPFDRIRCWLDIPGAINQEENLYYNLGFVEKKLNISDEMYGSGRVLVIKDDTGKSDELISKLKAEGRSVIEIIIGEGYKKINFDKYTVGSSENDYVRLFTALRSSSVTDIIHVASIKSQEIEVLEQLETSQKNSLYSLYNIARAISINDIRDKYQLFIVSEYVNSVTNEEELIKAENAPLLALGKAITREHKNIDIRCIDIDKNTTIDEIYEAYKYQKEYRASYRTGKRYIEELRAVDIEEQKDQKIHIRSEGVYLITGGMGGIGFQFAKYLADKSKVKIGLVSRTAMPKRSLWDDILSKGQDKKVCEKIKSVKEIEAKGSTVECLSANVTDFEEMSIAINTLREKYGSIDGVIHGAGIAGDGYISKKDEAVFSSVIKPKIYGTWILDKLTKEDKLDFFVMFSSQATVLTVQGQGDYAAANSYMDAYAQYRSKKGMKTLSINWVAWKEIGMAVNHGANTDTVFKAIKTQTAIEAFEQALSKDLQRVLIGELNINSRMVFMLEKFPFKLERSIKQSLEKFKKKLETEEKSTQTEKKISELCREVLGIKEIDIDQSFFDLGADSIMLTRLSEKLEVLFPGKVNVTNIFGNPTIVKLAEFIDQQDEEVVENHKIEEAEDSRSRDIAIIGMSSRTSSADNVEELWQVVRNGKDVIGEFPQTRSKDIDGYLTYTGIDKNDIKYSSGGYLKEIDKFDYKYFRLTPKEASLMDPNQRLFLEAAYTAIEDAGYGGSKIVGTNTGIYAGFGINPRDNYARIISDVEPDFVSVSIPSNIPAIIPSRVSYVLDLKGPSLLLDTACSSSLVTIHLACKALREGECDMAIAGGIKIDLLPIEGSVDLGIESSDNRARTFDDSSDGTGTGEGVGTVMLKPLDKAIADGDNIYAVVKGSAINQDGSSAGITAPNASAQTQVILKAWKDARVNPETISYIEAHGTGTKLGDPIEIDALTKAFRKYTQKKQFCAISSVKTNIGHLFEAAAVTGVIKSVMSLKNREIAPTVHFKKPNHRIDFEESPVYVSTELSEWKADNNPRRCGVSAFGLSGTNCHLVLEEYVENDSILYEHQNNTGALDSSRIFTVSAKSEEALKALVEEYRSYCKHQNISFNNMCYTANTGRGHYDYRIAFIVSSVEELASKLNAINLEQIDREDLYGRVKIVNASRVAKQGELSREDIKELNKEVNANVREYLATGKTNIQLLEEICRLYIKGGEVAWDELYEGEKLRRISMPTYPFDKIRCWVDVPQVDVEDINTTEIYYSTNYIQQDLDKEGKTAQEGTVLVFRNRDNRAEALVDKLRNTCRVIEVYCEEKYAKIDDNRYTIGKSEQDYNDVIKEAKALGVKGIIHTMTLCKQGVYAIENIENTQELGLYSLFNLISAIDKNNLNKIDLTLISEYADNVNGLDQEIFPNNSSFFGLAKGIQKEYQDINVRCIDVDEITSIDTIYEAIMWQKQFKSAYRNNIRYIEQFGKLDIDEVEDNNINVKEDGVYIITGGTGGIGLEVAKWLATKNRVKLALINRSQMPEKEQWDEILLKAEDKKNCETIKGIRSIIANGSEVICVSADISDIKEMNNAVNNIREGYGKINGIIHAAGLSGDGNLSSKDRKSFDNIIKSKIKGTIVLDEVTKNDSLDFLVLFSSIATTFCAVGQADYVAANAFMDAFGEYRNKQGKNTLVVNWVIWKEVGMAAANGMNIDTIFKAIPTKTALDSLEVLLSKNINRAIVGELNLSSNMALMIENSDLQLSKQVKNLLEVLKKKQQAKKTTKVRKSSTDIKLIGRESEAYSEIEHNLAKICREVLGIKEIDVEESFFDLGADSILVSQMGKKIEEEYPGRITVAKIFAYPTIAKLADYLNQSEEAKLEVACTEEKATNGSKDIAVIGISFKLPMANNEDELWSKVRNASDCIRKFPISRKKDVENYLKFFGVDKSSVRFAEGGFIEEIDKFDYKFFKITPKEASLMDPNQRLFLETVWSAIEDSGYGGKRLVGSNTGMYVGFSSNFKDNYGRIISEVEPESMAVSLPGNLASIIPSRVSYILDLKGPSILIDTACSSSLVSVHLACKALRDGECDMAVAGGAKISLLPIDGEMKLGIESSDNRARTFDDSSDGTGIGEGVGAVILKPVDKALEDGDNIYAVIKGSAVNQDGSSAGITAPNATAQTQVILNAWKDSQVNPETISYIEAHGTGTKLGDPIEIEAVTQAFRKYTDKKQFCAISSVKTSIGHLFEAAGIAGLIKVVLTLKNKELTPNVHFKKPNHRIDFEESPVYVNDGLNSWNTGSEPRRCGISAFGFSGTNCHMVLEEAPLPKVSVQQQNKSQYEILTLSAKSEEALTALVKRYKQFLKKDIRLKDLCYTANTGRGHYDYRISIITNSKQDLIQKVDKLSKTHASESKLEGIFYGEIKVAYDGVDAKEGELTKKDIKKFTKEAEGKLNQCVECSREDKKVLEDLCKLYASGADINWINLYEDERTQKVSLPTYPFEKTRCWINIPGTVSIGEENVFYTLGFKQEELSREIEICGSGSIVVIKDNTGKADKLCGKLREEGRTVIEVGFGDDYRKISDESYKVNDSEEAYVKLFSELKKANITDIIHLSSLRNTDIKHIEHLEHSQRYSIYSVYYLIRAIHKNSITHNIGLVLLTDYVNAITGEEEFIKPENAPVFALGKAVEKEHSNIRIRCIDIDNRSTIEEIYDAFKWQYEYRASYRRGKRYIEQFKSVDVNNADESNIEIKEDGVYVITGGMGGIGFEVAKYLADKNKVNIGLIGRTRMPNRSEWEEILLKGQNKKLCKKIQAVNEIEEKGSIVDCLCADVSNIEQMNTAISSLREKHGKIDGVIHGAGVAGDGYITKKDENIFSGVIQPKIYGTWILDEITKNDNLDFLILFSSVATVLTVYGQGDYAAANSYMDSFAELNSKKGRKTLAINWVSWKETGMAVNHGVNTDTVFKAIHTERAIDAFSQAISKDVERLLIGELNMDSKMVLMLEKFPFQLTNSIKQELDRCRRKFETEEKSSETEKKITDTCREVLGIKEIDVEQSFFDLGADSIMITKLSEKLELIFPGKVTVSKIFGYPTISKLAEHIDQQGATVRELVTKENDDCSKEARDVAIIGISLRMPGADNAEELWSIARNGEDYISSFPQGRKRDIDNYLSHIGMYNSEIKYTDGAYLDNIDKFDYKYFKLTPKDASIMDPNQRLFLEAVNGAIEDAGYGGRKIEGSKTGVYAGFASSFRDNYGKMVADVDPESISMSIPGNIPAIIPSRASYVLDLKGPSMLLDTACSSSLVSVHLACKALREGECHMAVAGGVKINLMPIDGQIKLGIESSDNRARTFDDSSDGTGIGEGVGAVMLKPLNKAMEDGDNIYAVIKGSAVNQDGSSAGITAPNLSAQTDVILDAWKDAEVNPETISFIEAHGTGTKLGDPIEIEGLTQAFRRYTDKKQFCAISSIKTNIGHLFEAAGIAGLIKAVMSLKNKELAPTVHFEKPNRRIEFEESPVYVSSELTEWKSENAPRRCGISAFGFSGTNCHMILEEAPPTNNITTLEQNKMRKPEIVTLSAKSKEALKSMIKDYSKLFTKDIDIRNLCYTANTGRGHYNYRLCIIAEDSNNLKESFEELSKANPFENSISNVCYGEIKIAFEGVEAKSGELTKQDIKQLSKDVDLKIKEYIANGKTDLELLREIGELYIKGAEVAWDDIYEGEKLTRISLPTYPFDKVRCWLDIPGAISQDEIQMYYSLGFKEKELNTNEKVNSTGSVLVFKDNINMSEALCEKLKAEGRDVIEITFGSTFNRLNSESYIIENTEQSYEKLFEELKTKDIADIIHFASLKNQQIHDLKQLQDSQKVGVYSLYYIARAMYKNNISNNLGLFLVSDYVNSVTGKEEHIKAENAPLFTLGKAIALEYNTLNIRCMDIDNETTMDDIYNAFVWQKEYRASYRKQSRYVEDFEVVDVDKHKDKKVEIKEDGVYVITGGMGGIGFEFAKYIASKNKVKLGLITRTSMPDRALWDSTLTANKDKKICERIKSVKAIEATGSTVECISANVTNLEEMSNAVKVLRQKYGKINGVVHGAGVAGDGFIVRKDEKIFSSVIEPKVYGTWILDYITDSDNLDFFVMFSSQATALTVQGQGDYAAANSYMDSFAEYRSKKDKKTLTINWVAWKEIGMAVNYGANNDTIFKAIYTSTAIKAFEKAFSKDISRVLIGELNLEDKIVLMLEKFPFELSDEVKNYLSKFTKRMESKKNTLGMVDKVEELLANADLPENLSTELQSMSEQLKELLNKCEEHVKQKNSDVSIANEEGIVLKGRDNNDYKEYEKIVAQIWSKVLGIKEFDIEDNYFAIGGDSIKAIQIAARLKEYGFPISVNDLMQNLTIESLSEYINQMTKVEEESKENDEITLTPYQQYLFEELDTDINKHTITTVSSNEQKFDYRLVEQVIQKLVEHHDGLRTMFNIEGNSIAQFSRAIEDGIYELKEIDLGDNTYIEERIKQTADKLQSSFDVTTGSMLKAIIVKSSSRDYIVIAVHGLVADSISSKTLLEDFRQAYTQLVNGESIKLPNKTQSFKKWSKILKENAESKELARQAEYWKKLSETNIEKLPIDDIGRYNGEQQMNNVSAVLSQEYTSQLLGEANEAYNTTPKDILLIGLGLSVERCFNIPKVLINLTGDGRINEISEELDVSRTLGQFQYNYPALLDISESKDLEYRIKNIKEGLRHIPYEGIGYGILKYLTNAKESQDLMVALNPQISFMYLEEGEQVQELYNNSFDTGYDLEIIAKVLDTELQIQFNYNISKYNEDTINKLIEYYRKSLVEIIEHCNNSEEVTLTPTDLGSEDLSVEELEDILDLLD